jgi:hypothetical protein
MNKILLGFCLLFVSTILSAQTTPYSRKRVKRKQLKSISSNQINQLQGGALLIRLHTNAPSIESLRKLGDDKKANKIERKQIKLNTEVSVAFRNHFDFCPTYFFYSEQSVAVREKQFQSVDFLNDSLQPDRSIVFSNHSFLTAEFSTIEQDTNTYFKDYHYVGGAEGIERRTSYYGGATMGFGALVIKSDQFIQLCRPFPYYVRTLDSSPFKRRPKKVVKKLNKKLHAYSRRVN